MSTRMQQRRGTASQWLIADPILAEGELGWESDTNKFKFGDGVNNWSTLEYFEDATAISGSLEDYVEVSLLGVADGVATLDATGNVPANQLANVDFTGYATESYVTTAISNVIDAAPAALDTLNELAAALGDDANFATTITNALAGKADTSHTHTISDVSGLQTALDTKATETYVNNAVASAQPTFTNNFMLMGA